MMHSSHTVFWRTHLSIIEECRQHRDHYALTIILRDGPPKLLVDSFSQQIKSEYHSVNIYVYIEGIILEQFSAT